MGPHILDNGSDQINMDMGYRNGKMVLVMKVIGIIMWLKVKANLPKQTVMFMKVSGQTTKLMGMAHILTLISMALSNRGNILGNGSMIYNMVMAKNNGQISLNTKDHISKVTSMEREYKNGLMGLLMKVIGNIISQKVKEN